MRRRPAIAAISGNYRHCRNRRLHRIPPTVAAAAADRGHEMVSCHVLRTHSARDEACLSLRGAPALTPKLLSDLIAQACARFASPHELARAGIERLTRSGAWTDAALALVELELPRWRLRRLVHDGGEWRWRSRTSGRFHRPRRDRRSQPRDHVAGDPDRIHRGIAASGGGERAVVAGGTAGCSSGRLSGLLRQLCLIAPCRPDRMAGPALPAAARAQYPRKPPKRMLSPARTTLVDSLTSTSPGRNPASSGVNGTRPEP